MELRALRYAITLAEELHFGRAAQRHYISEQPFGRQIRALERELGQPLFDRTTRRVTLSPTGTTFLAQTRRLLTALDEAVEGMRLGRAEQDDHLVFGVLGFGLADMATLVSDALAQQLPGLTLSFRELDFLDQHEAVCTGAVDIAVVPVQEPVDGLEVERLFSVPRVVIVPARSEFADAERLQIRELEGAPWLPVSFGHRAEVEWAWPQPHVESRSSVVTPAAVPAAVAVTSTISFHGAPARKYFPHPAVRFVECDGRGISVCVATREGDRRPMVQAARRVITSAVAHHPDIPDAIPARVAALQRIRYMIPSPRAV
jgi:DNA-binding transcriptional LysR family regulator